MANVIYAMSDSVGETAEMVARATASQFGEEELEIVRVSYVLSEGQIDEVIDKCVREGGMICHTIVMPRLRAYIEMQAEKADVICVDILGPTLWAAERITSMEPSMRVGMVRQLNKEYYKKVEAMEFAVQYDDGKDPRGFLKADIVIVGVSRTSKTPLSMYLAYNSIKVANLPLVPEIPLPDEILRIPPRKIVGLLIDTYKLNGIRTSRMEALGVEGHSNYSDVERIDMEMEYAREVYRRLHCQILDVSNKSIEETAAHIMTIVEKNREMDAELNM